MSYLHFPVSHSMAPLSHLLVYYVRENGEGVTDSVQIPVQPDFENQVCFIPKLVLFLMFCSVGANAFFSKVNALVPQGVAFSNMPPCAPNCCYGALCVNQQRHIKPTFPLLFLGELILLT